MKSLNDIASRSVLSLEKLVRIEEYIVNTGYITSEKARRDMEWFIIDLGIDEYYFRTTSENDIARHLIALSASELIALYGGSGAGMQLIGEREDKAVYIVEDTGEKTLEIEGRIEKNYPGFHLESYITKKTAQSGPFRFYVLTKPVFSAGKGTEGVTPFEKAASGIFLSRAVPETVLRYREAWEAMDGMEAPFVSVSVKPESDETRIMIGLKGTDHRRTLTTFAHLLASYGVSPRRKYVEPFADGKRITSLYFPRLSNNVVADLRRDLNVCLMLPNVPESALFFSGTFSPQTAMYAVAAAAVTHQFLSVMTEEYVTLQRALKDQPEARGIVDNLKLHLLKDTYSTARISATVANNLKIVQELFGHFRLCVGGEEESSREIEAKRIRQLIDREVSKSKDRIILQYFLRFNESISITNFFKIEKACVAFRLDPGILDPVDFPERPFGLFFLIGHDFLGFHMRFRDIARGGIRIVRSRSVDVYAHNIDTIFSENYNLAMTQQRKNKDIPEGGAKGTILLHMGSQEAADRAFKDYVDGLLDLLVELDANGNTTVREILFLGPDEGSAGLMDWAALHARSRG
ncbi:MAG: NAD-glutamate dehydrogenase domain-containing protein, partial [Treponemataceae bacterium]